MSSKAAKNDTFYRIMYTTKANPETWNIKCNCKTQAQAEKFVEILQAVSDVYLELKVVSVELIPVLNQAKKGKEAKK